MKLLLVFLLPLAILGAQAEAPFKSNLSYQDCRVQVCSPNKSAGNTVTIALERKGTGGSSVTRPIEGIVSKAEMVDLLGDGTPEVFVYAVRSGSGSYGDAVAFAVNRKNSLSELFIFPPGKTDLRGYMGHDDFAVVESSFIRRFPVYKPGDANATPTGGWRQLDYHLKAGEACWQLKISKVESY